MTLEQRGHFIQDPTTGLLQGSEPGPGHGEGEGGEGGGKGDHPGPGYSASAHVDKNGVIHTSNVYDAQRALSENRKVELNQPRTVSVLLKRLGEVSKKMIAQGKEAPTFNLCNVSLKGTNLFCADSKGIERVKMPQLDKQQTKDFLKYLKKQDYEVTKEKQFASHLRATQNELNGAKVAAGAEKIRENDGKVKSIIISKDDYILDGHHAWAAKLGLDAADNILDNDTKMRVSRVDISITKLLAEAEKFTGGKGHKDVGETKSLGDIMGEFVRDVDYIQDPTTGHLMGSHGHGIDAAALQSYSEDTASDHIGSSSHFDFRPGGPMPSQTGILTVHVDYDELSNHRDIPLSINPTAGDIKKIARESEGGSGIPAARVLRDSAGNIYVWPADAALHADVMDALPFDGNFNTDQWSLTHGKLISDYNFGVEQVQDWLKDSQLNAKTAETASVGFVSPNVRTDLSFGGAVAQLSSEQQQALVAASSEIDRKLGIRAKESNVIGAWADGAENSVMMTAGTDWDHVEVSTLMKGYLANQKSVLVFQQDNDSHDGALMSFRATGTLEDIHKGLLEDGLAFHTLVPDKDGATVYIGDTDGSLADVVEKGAERYGSKVTIQFGHLRFIGDTKDYTFEKAGTGTESEQRDRARGIYEEIIRESNVAGSAALWADIRDHWSKAPEVKGIRYVYVRSSLVEAHRIISLIEASGDIEIIPYDGEHIPGTELIDLGEWDGRQAEPQSEPKTLYVNRPLLNADEVIGWAKSNGFAKTITADDMHVTLAFSRAPVDWDTLTENHSTLTISSGGPRSVERLGPNGEAVVLRFESQALQERWAQFKKAGASWDYDDYRPHVTISFDAPEIKVEDIEPYDGELVFGPEVFAELKEDWKATVTEKAVDYIQDPATGHLMGSHPQGGDKEGGDKPEGGKIEPSKEAMAVGGDEWNQQTAERLEKEFVEAAPKLEEIVNDAVSSKAEVTVGSEGPDPDNAPVVPEEWDMMSGDDQDQSWQEYKDKTFSDFQDSEIQNWQENSAMDDAASEVAYNFTKGKTDEWAYDAIKDFRADNDLEIPFTDAQLVNALVVDFENNGYNDASKVDISFDDSKLGKPSGFDESPQFPGIEPQKPEDFLTKEMRDALETDLNKAFVKEAERVVDKIEPPDYLNDSVAEYQETVWGDMSDKEKFSWVESNTDLIKDKQEEYDKYFGDEEPGVTGKIAELPKKFDPLQQNASAEDYQRTQQIARHLSVERAAQIMMDRKVYQEIEDARRDAKLMDRRLWEAWKGSSHSELGQLLQKATADELGGRLNPQMVTLSKLQIDNQAAFVAPNAKATEKYEAVKAYIRGKWETSQYLLKKAGIETVNTYRAVNIKATAPPNKLGPGEHGDYRVSVTKSFSTKEEAERYMDDQAAIHKSDYSGSVDTDHGNPRVFSKIEFRSEADADAYIKSYVSDPNNPEQHTEEVPSPYGKDVDYPYTRLPDIHVVRNGAASTSINPGISNGWDGGSGRVVLRASVPRTAVVSVPAYGINIQSEQEVVVAGTAWKSWSAWREKAPAFSTVPEEVKGIAA